MAQPSFRDGPKDQTSGAQLRTGESRDSGLRCAPRDDSIINFALHNALAVAVEI